MHSTASVVPLRFQDRTFENYEPKTSSQREAVAAAEVASRTGTDLVLVGPTGLGKTHLAAAVVNDITRREAATYETEKVAAEMRPQYRHPIVPNKPEWANVADLIVSLRIEMSAPPDDKNAEATMRRLRHHPALVVLDDLGRERTSDWTAEIVYSLVNWRYENRLPTIVTSNATPFELSASPYWPIISRMAQDGQLVQLEGADWRLEGGADTAAT